MAYLIGLDLGTSRCKAVAVTPEGEVLGRASAEYPLKTPHPDWAEQNLDDVWDGVVSSLRALTAQLPNQKPMGISLSGAMHSLFPVDENGAPLAQAMTWADQRAAAKVRSLQQRVDHQTLQESTGCPLQYNYFPARLCWWQEENPSIFQSAATFVGIKDFILSRLCGNLVTDLGMASTSGLLNIHDLTWDEQALELAGIEAKRLPALVSPQEMAGNLVDSVAEQIGLPGGLPVVAGTSDGGLANLGAGAFRPGQSVITVGTSGAVRQISSAPQADRNGRTWCYVLLEDRWFKGGAINNGGLAIQWVRARFYPQKGEEAGFKALFDEAAEVPAGSQGIFFLPYLTGERSPHWNSSVRGLLHGLSLETGRAQIARAALEGVAFCLADVWQALEENERSDEPIRLTGSITRDPVWMQILADVLGLEMAPIEVADASALGAAILGLAALGLIPNIEALAESMQPTTIVKPDGKAHAHYQKLHQQFQALYSKLES